VLPAAAGERKLAAAAGERKLAAAAGERKLAAAAGERKLPAAGADAPPRLSDRDQPLRDGCQRSDLNVVLVNSPEWVYVNEDPAIRVAEGISRVTHVATTDNPGTHRTFDLVSNLDVDRRYGYLIAGSPLQRTNNFAGGAEDNEERGRLHYEWELGSFPQFAWPADGDRTKLWGSWIWDCGHFTTDGALTGERSEFHPLNAVVVSRTNPYAARRGESETDAYISSDGTYAHAQEDCARKGRPQPDGSYGSTFFGCARDRRNQPQPLARRYRFFVPAPRRPRGAGRLVYRTTTMARTGRLRERIGVGRDGLAVTVAPRSKRLRYGKRFFVRWSRRASAVMPLKITVRDVLVKRADPDGDYSDDPNGAHGVIYFAANGRWQLLNDWNGGLAYAHDGELFPMNRSFRINVRRGGPVVIFAHGFECDQPSGKVVFGHYVPVTPPCPPTPEEDHISSTPNDNLGAILDRYRSATAALGTHTSHSSAGVRFPHTGEISLGRPDQGEDVYELTYTVSRG
jgi:hypothetical protein